LVQRNSFSGVAEQQSRARSGEETGAADGPPRGLITDFQRHLQYSPG